MRMTRMLMILLILLPVVAAASLCWWGGRELVMPPRRAMQDYHLEFLKSPGEHGVVVKPFTASDGTPCLVCEPTKSVGKRGQAVRDTLAAKNMTLSELGKVNGTIVLVHGRRGRKEDYLLIAERLCAVGFRCVLMDLPAHGEHPAELATYGLKEADLPLGLLREAAQRFHFEPAPAGLLGMSMGGAVSVRAAALGASPWRALVLISTFDSLGNVLQHQSGKIVGRRLGGFLQAGITWEFHRRTGHHLNEVNSLHQAKLVHCPTLVAHGTADTVIPLQLGERLYAALPASIEKQWVTIPGADHHNVLVTDFPIYATVAEWMLRYVRE